MVGAFHQAVEALIQVVLVVSHQEALHQVVLPLQVAEEAFHLVLLVASAADLATNTETEHFRMLKMNKTAAAKYNEYFYLCLHNTVR